MFDSILFSFIQIKLIKNKNCDSKWFFTIAVHYELKKINRNIFTSFFLQNCKKTETEINAFCVINFEQIEVQTHSAPQNHRLNLSFVKNINVDGRKVARNGRKTAIYRTRAIITRS